MRYAGQTKRCAVCGQLHRVNFVVPLALIGPTRVEVDLFVCSNSCLADLVFEVPPEVSEARKLASLNALLAAT